MTGKRNFDVIIIGCGIAGCSLAYFLVRHGITDILLLAQEAQPGYHATGRSAAVLVEMDLIPALLELKLLGAQFLRNPPEDFSENPLLHPSGILVLFQGPLWQKAEKLIPYLKSRGTPVEVLSHREAMDIVPVLSS
jgi:D-arginine dehydrogenase